MSISILRVDGTNQVLHASESGINIEGDKFWSDTFECVKPLGEVYFVEEVNALPDGYLDGHFMLSQDVWAVIDQVGYNEVMARTVNDAAVALVEDIKKERAARLYTDITVPFPATSHTIQFRDDRDRTNLSDKVTGAVGHILGGNPGAAMKYRTANNEDIDLTAQELLTAGMGILQVKDALWREFTALIDAARAATTIADLDQVKADLALLLSE